MKYMLSRAATAVVPFLALLSPAAVAQAEPPGDVTIRSQTSCQYSAGSDGRCWTGALSANPRYHAIYIQARAFAGPHSTSCYLWDNRTWQRVGEVHAEDRTESKVVRGLYGTYELFCNRVGGGEGAGDGMMANDNWWVD